MALTLADADRAIAAARAAGVVLQVGFNRRFAPDWAAARALLDDGTLGTPRLLRSVTRDPGGFDPARVPPNTIFLETLIHDFDTLRFLNPGAEAVEVYATADALVEPDWRDRGLLDTAVVTVRFDNGAVGTAEACFEAAYGYDVRGEVFGSGGMATMGDGRRTGHGVLRRRRPARRDGPRRPGTVRRRLHRGTGRVRRRRPHRHAGRGDRGGRPRRAGDRPGRRGIGRAPGARCGIDEVAQVSGLRLAVCARDGVPRAAVHRPGPAHRRLGFEVEIWDWTTKDIDALAATGATFSSMTGYITGTLADPDGADELLRTAELSLRGRRAARLPAAQRARHRPGRRGLPVTRDRRGDAGDVADRRPDPDPASPTSGERAGRVFTLENLNTAVDHPGTPFAKAADTLALVEAVDNPHLRMNLDLYHAQIGEGNLIQLVERALPLVGEIQVADVPGRCEPGTGEINYPAIAAALHRLGYDGRRRPRRLGVRRFGAGAGALPRRVHRLTSARGGTNSQSVPSAVG